MNTTTIRLEAGEVYLTGTGDHLQEIEIKEVATKANAVRTKNGWTAASAFVKTIRGKLGHYEYKKGIFKTKKVFVAALR